MSLNSAQCGATYHTGGTNRQTVRNAIKPSKDGDFAQINVKFSTGESGNQTGEGSVGKAIGIERSQSLLRSEGNVCIAELRIFACLILTILTLRKRTSQRTENIQHRLG